MKKAAFPTVFFLLGVVLSGCPVYQSDAEGCFSNSDCALGYVCDARTDSCVVDTGQCSQPSDCGKNETCSRAGTCVAGDCHFASVGCVTGYTCSSDSGLWECVEGAAGEGGTASTSAGAPGVPSGGQSAEGGMTSAGAGG